jgi:acetoacetyl-CoA synthetase
MPDNSRVPDILFSPTENDKNKSRLSDYMLWLKKNHGLIFHDYDALWKWSIEEPAFFWTTLLSYFKVNYTGDPGTAMSLDPMPDTRWFEGIQINYAEQVFSNRTSVRPAILFQSEQQELTPISWKILEDQTAALAAYFRSIGIQRGDRVAAYLPNIPEATVALLACLSIGAIWSSCSPDFGTGSIVDRFLQITPKVLIAVDGYQYGGKGFDKRGVVREIALQIPTIEKVIFIPYLNAEASAEGIDNIVQWQEVIAYKHNGLFFEPVPFGHPAWILYSSGTTGIPKAITHSQGGVLLEHLKYLAFHNDVHPGECFFWFTTTGWMMWNFLNAALLAGATIVVYDGSPGYPNLSVLWKLAEKARIQHFGTSAPYLVACMKDQLVPGKDFDLSELRSIGSTGSPLPPEAFAYVYQHIKPDVWLASMSGGTDVCTAWIGGNPLLPVYEGEIQCRCLGCAMESWDENGHPVFNEVGEMVVTKPMPSMPVFFWNDPDKQKYLGSYFEHFKGVWRHGDWIKITDRGTLVILGRSDATLNRQGIRIGTAEIYRAVDEVPQVKDSLIVCLEFENGEQFMPLFVIMQKGEILDDTLKKKINTALRSTYSPRHVPDQIIEVPDIPYTMSGKKMEAPVKKILMGIAREKAANLDSVRNPDSLDFFIAYAKTMKRVN